MALFDKTLASLIFALLGMVKQVCLCTRLPQKMVLALARAALPMCAMCVGASFFLLRVGEKNKINSSNLHCPVKKLNPFFRYYLSLSYLSARLSFYTCCQRTRLCEGAVLREQNCRTATKPERAVNMLNCTFTALLHRRVLGVRSFFVVKNQLSTFF
jgi:hypothetical protein